ncbi:hypothetical protein FACS1894137_14120 [Spirochaetia bacterium]|nr:hypothetical protein FACS1894137_14120 [Spirochaetia bacterium]
MNPGEVKQNYGITHSELCLKTAQRFAEKVALYEYKSYVSQEEPDVLAYGFNGTTLFEIKMSLSDFNADKYKDCRVKYHVPHWAGQLYYSTKIRSPTIDRMAAEQSEKTGGKKIVFECIQGKPEAFLIEREHLGNRRYFVCPDKLIPVEKLPEGWGLYYYKNGKFYLKKGSKPFRSNLRKENHLLIHAMRRYGSGDSTGIIINTYNKD